jgi:outer membrane lipoprotein-sorting protein
MTGGLAITAAAVNFECLKLGNMKFLLAGFMSFFLLTGLKAQTADDIIGRYVQAMGGLDKLRSLKSIDAEAVTVMGNGNEVQTHIYRVQGKLYRREVNFGMGSFISIVTDSKGWMSNPRGEAAFQDMPQAMWESQLFELDCQGPLVDYAAKGNRVELMGMENVNKKNCYKLRLTLKSGRELNYYIDDKDFYIQRLQYKTAAGMRGRRTQDNAAGPAEVDMSIDYADYRKTDEGYVFPYTVTMPGMGGRSTSMQFEKIDVNQPVDEKLFRPE